MKLQPTFVMIAVIFAVLCGIISYFNIFLGLICLILAVVFLVTQFNKLQYNRDEVLHGVDKLYQRFDAQNRRQMNQLPVSYVIVDKNGDIVWYNEAFQNAFYEKKKDIIGKNISNELNLELEDCFKENPTYKHRKIDYEIVTQKIKDSRGELYIINFFDVTLLNRQKEIYSRYEPIFCYMTIDNYDESIDSLPSLEKSTIMSQIDLTISDWANRKDAFTIHYENDRYLVIFEREKLQSMVDANFHILDIIRDIENESNVPLSLSIGIGVSNNPITIKEADERSHAALEIAQARGGDQAVLKIDDDIQYYGGQKEAVERNNKVRAHYKALALKELMKDADNILIMGHHTPDMDCLGAGIGLIDAANSMNQKARFIIEDFNYGIKALKDYVENEGYGEYFITHEEAEELIRDNTLLIVVDTQKKNYTEYPEIIEKVNNVVVLDHHRRPDGAIEKPTLEYSEVYASSTCELVTEVLSYFDSKTVLKPVGATVLLSGIYMDTKMFVNKTGVRTFEAASFLKRRGAETQKAKLLLQDDFKTYSKKLKIMDKASIYYDSIAVSLYQDNSEYAKIIAAQAADEMLNIKNIKASFVIIQTDEGINISGRSNKDINVQLILEALGGGGHLQMAGAQLPNTYNLEEAKELLLEKIGLYMEERNKNFEDNIT